MTHTPKLWPYRKSQKQLEAENKLLRAQNKQLDAALKKAHDEIDLLTGYASPALPGMVRGSVDAVK